MFFANPLQNGLNIYAGTSNNSSKLVTFEMYVSNIFKQNIVILLNNNVHTIL